MEKLKHLAFLILIIGLFSSCGSGNKTSFSRNVSYSVDSLIIRYAWTFRKENDYKKDLYFAVWYDKIDKVDSVLQVSMSAWSRPYSESEMPFRIMEGESDAGNKDVIFFYSQDSTKSISKNELIKESLVLINSDVGIVPPADREGWGDSPFNIYLFCKANMDKFLPIDTQFSLGVHDIPRDFKCYP